MKRTLLAMCLSLLTGLAFAGEAATGNAEDAHPLCPKAAAKVAASRPVEESGASAPASAARARGGGGTSTTKLSSPRWHTLLPGMFR